MDKTKVIAADRLRTHSPRKRHMHGKVRLRHHAVQFKRGAVRQEIGRGTGEFARNQVRAVDVLGGPAEFERHEVEQTRLETRHQAALLGFVHEIAGRRSRQAGDRARIRQSERRAAQFIQIRNELCCPWA